MSPVQCLQCGLTSTSLTPAGLCPTCDTAGTRTHAGQSAGVSPPSVGDRTTASAPETHDAPAAPTAYRPASGYRRGEQLGRGGMGTVYKAVQLSTGQAVAVKVLNAESASPTLLARFTREARALAALHHPHVVRLYDFVPDGREPFLVMEYVTGGTLSDRIGEAGLPPAAAARLLAAAARGVHAAHEQGIVHRDLKPNNLLLTAAGVLKVSDFGLAQRLDHDDTVTRTGQPVGGTPGYMAPEQVDPAAPECDARTDVWGLGATLYATLVGRPPYPTGPKNALKVLSQPFRPPRAVNPAVPRELDAIVCKCLDKERVRRYESAAAVADDLDRWLRGEPTVARPLTWPTRAWKRLRRAPKATVAAWAMAAVAVAAGWIAAAPRLPFTTPGGLIDRRAGAAAEEPQVTFDRLMATGRPVRVFAEGKLPVPIRWRLGRAACYEHPSEPRTYHLSGTPELVFLDLTPPVRAERYTAGLELQLTDLLGGAASFAGVYLAWPEVIGADHSRLIPVRTIRIRDFDSHAALNGQPKAGQVSTHLHLLTQHPGRPANPNQPGGMLGAVPFQPLAQLPAPWRRFRFAVTPESVVATWWPDPDGRPEQIPMTAIPDMGKELNAWAGHFAPAAKTKVPTPAGPYVFGVWSHRASVSVRECVIDPSE